jgi:16S rRNA processing protein RimM
MVMEVLTDFPDRLKPGIIVYIGEEHQPVKISSRRGHLNGFLVTFEGHESPEMTTGLRNQYLYVSADDRPPLPEGEYYHHQLLGLKVVSDEGQELGRLAGILETGANDVYIVRSEAGAEILLPNISSVVLNVDLEISEMHVHLIPGLLP